MSSNDLGPLAVILVGNSHTFYAALMALEKEKIDTANALLIVNSIKPSIEVIEKHEWFDVQYVYIKKTSKSFLGISKRFSHIIWGLKAKAVLKSVNTHAVRCFVAAHYDWVSHVGCYHAIKSINKRFIVVDDGMKNIILEHSRVGELSQRRPDIFYMGGYKRRPVFEQLLFRVISFIVGIEVKSVPILSWYTRLPIKSFSNCVNDEVVDLSQATNYAAIDSGVAHFISQPLLGRGNIDENLLAEVFRSIRAAVPADVKIIYIAHRSEALLQQELASKVFIVDNEGAEPYEMLFSKLKKKPGTIISLYSSVLFTLHREIENGVKFLAVYSKEIDVLQEQRIRLLYNAMNASGYVCVINASINK